VGLLVMRSKRFNLKSFLDGPLVGWRNFKLVSPRRNDMFPHQLLHRKAAP
jgi:hypothetical protein